MRSAVVWTVSMALATGLAAQDSEAQRTRGPVRVEQVNENLDMGSKLWVRNRNGGIRVVGWDRATVALTAEIRDTPRRKVSLVLSRKPDGLEVDTQISQPTWNFSFGFVTTPRCEMTISVPRRLLGHFSTSNGQVQASDIQGFLHLETTNGDVRVQDVQGEVHLHSVNGDLDARRLAARVKGGTTNGSIHLVQVAGGIRLETTNGEISARDLDGWGEGIRLETTNGTVEVELGKATGDVSGQNQMGSVDVKVPGAQVVESSRHRVVVRIPGKNQRIECLTVNGTVKIRP